MKTKLILFLITFVAMVANAQCTGDVTIPDTNFKTVLLNNTNINTDGNTQISCAEAAAYTGVIQLYNKSVNDLTGIEAFINITNLDIRLNNLTSIDISSNTALTSLNFSNNSLTSLDVSKNTALTTIEGGYNNLTNFDVSNNISLNGLSIDGNLNLMSLDVSENTMLTILTVSSTSLTVLDVSKNTALTYLNCDSADLTSLDVSANTALYILSCSRNDLSSLNIANGNNSNMSTGSFRANYNPNLTCIQVDDVSYATTNFTNIDASASFSTDCTPCTVNIPDTNFKANLVANTAINTNGDTEIQCSEASAFTGNMYCPSLSISDLTGIEAFTNLTRLTCSDNALTSIDVSNNTALEFLDCEDNSLTNLDVSNNTALDYLVCGDNALTNLDVSNNTALEGLICDNNALTSLNVSNNTVLDELRFHHNQIASINISSNTLLTSLHCYANLLTSLDVSANIYLYDLYCSFNSLTSLDVSDNPDLRFLDCTSNSLTSLNVANGNNASFPVPPFQPFKATNNPDLTCIQIDAGFSPPSNWLKDVTASFSTSCTPCTVNIPDVNFKAFLVGRTEINTNGDTEIQCSEAAAYPNSIDCSGLNISDLTGIEGFTSLHGLNFINNQITSVDVSAITTLTFLYGNYNQLTSIDVSTNSALENLQFNNNQLTSVDVSACTSLLYLFGDNNILTNLDLSNNTALQVIYCNDNQLTSLDVSANTTLRDLSLYNNQLTNLDVSANTNLKLLSAGLNQITSLDVSANIALEELYFSNNQLTSLVVSTNSALQILNCNDNQLTSLDVSAINALAELYCNDNQLTSLNIANGNNANWYYFDATNNTALTCIEVDAAIVGTSPTDWYKDAGATYNVNCGALSVDDFSLNTVSIYPNPTTSVLNIKMESNLKHATIYSVLGTKVLETTSKNITTSNLSKGIYLLKIEDENGFVSSKRFIKQ